MSKPPIYLDYAAATPVSSEVFDAMRPYFSDKFYNPSAEYMPSRAVAADIAQARAVVASHLGAKPTEVHFFAGGTEANNAVIRGISALHPRAKIVVSAVEHDSVLAPAQQSAVSIVPVAADGRIQLEDLRAAIDSETVLVSVMYVNNEIGTIQPLRKVSQLIAEERQARQKAGNQTPLYLHTDAAQAGNYLDLHAHRLGVDLMTLNGGKLYGPKQSAVLYKRTGIELAPQILGGGQERGLRSGTENVAAIIGIAAALNSAQTMRHEESARVTKLRDLFIELLQENIPDCQFNGSMKYRIPNNVHVTFAGVDNERLMMLLDERGIICAMGSACSASNDEPSHVLKAIGLTDAQAQASLRFTLGRDTDEESIRRVVKEIHSLL